MHCARQNRVLVANQILLAVHLTKLLHCAFQMLEESGPGDLLSSIRFLKARTADLTV